MVFATLYLGTGRFETHLVSYKFYILFYLSSYYQFSDLQIETLFENANLPQVTILADATRSTRPLHVTAEFAGAHVSDNLSVNHLNGCPHPLYLLRRVAQMPQGRVALYHSHRLRGWLRRVLPERLNETVGLQHIKAYIFDDNVIVSG